MDLSYILVRVRGPVGVRRDVSHTLNLLRLPRRFHATIIPQSESIEGMLQKVKDYVMWGLADPEMVKKLLLTRGRLEGNKPLSEEYLLEKTGLKSLDDVAEALSSGKLTLEEIDGLKPVFRLHPPRGGFKHSTKKNVGMGGELGCREDIASIIERML
jgi:large subunit ribosomal protein L30